MVEGDDPRNRLTKDRGIQRRDIEQLMNAELEMPVDDLNELPAALELGDKGGIGILGIKLVVIDKETLVRPVFRLHDSLKRRAGGFGDMTKQERLETPQMTEPRETPNVD